MSERKWLGSALAKNKNKIENETDLHISSIADCPKPAIPHEEVERKTVGASHGSATNEGPPQGSLDKQRKPFYERFIKRKNTNEK